MINLFRNKLSHWEMVQVILDNQIIYNELELELATLWVELSHYNNEEWAEISVNGKDDVRTVIVSLPKLGEILTRNKWQEDTIAKDKLKQIIEEITGLPVKDVYMVDEEEFEVEFEKPIPRPRNT